MTYYEQLLSKMNKSMAAHPHSAMIMDYGSQKILATGRDLEKMGRKIRARKSAPGVSVIFQKSKENAVWILANRPRK